MLQPLKFILMHAEKNNGSTDLPKDHNNPVTTEERAQYEVFRNGNIPRETIEKWVRNDLTAIMSFVHGCLKDEEIFKALTDAFYARYQSLHNKTLNENSDVEETAN